MTDKRNSPYRRSDADAVRLCSVLLRGAIVVTFIGYAAVGFVPWCILIILLLLGGVMIIVGAFKMKLRNYQEGTMGFDICYLSRKHGAEILVSTFVLGATDRIADSSWGIVVVLIASALLGLLAIVFVWDYAHPDPPRA